MIFKDGQFYTTEQISPHMEKTSEGYLLCRDVPISRVGVFDYSPIEVGFSIKGSRGGVVKMTRTAEELFAPATIASFNGKPVVIGHGHFADPSNWREITVGIVQNVRRGSGSDSDKLLADLLLTDRKGIELVERGDLREVSCGYDADAIEDADGEGHQAGIVGNHVALVDRARCGHTCQIRDGEMISPKQLLRRLFKDGDEEALNEALDQMEIREKIEDEEPDAAVPPVDPESPDEDRLAVLEHEYQELAQKINHILERLDGKAEEEVEEVKEELTDEEPEGMPEEDLVGEEEVREVLADAETICPGMKRPQGDSADGKFTRSHLERIMRTALKSAGVTQFGDSAELDGKSLGIALKASAISARQAKNPSVRVHAADGKITRLSNAELNKRNSDFWGKK